MQRQRKYEAENDRGTLLPKRAGSSNVLMSSSKSIHISAGTKARGNKPARSHREGAGTPFRFVPIRIEKIERIRMFSSCNEEHKPGAVFPAAQHQTSWPVWYKMVNSSSGPEPCFRVEDRPQPERPASRYGEEGRTTNWQANRSKTAVERSRSMTATDQSVEAGDFFQLPPIYKNRRNAAARDAILA